MHLERDRLVELEMRAAVEGDKSLSLELELDGHDRPGLSPMGLMALFAIAACPHDPGILEDGEISIGRILGLAIEPQAGRDLVAGDRHGLLPRRRRFAAAAPRTRRDGGPSP
jgi:hypothetical protein